MVDDIRKVLRDALEPVTSSVKEMGETFHEFQLTTATSLAEIHTDLKHVRREYGELNSDVKELREQQPLITAHMRREEDTATIKLAQATTKKSDPNTPSLRKSLIPAPVSGILLKLAPLFLAAAIGLVGIGFYLASGSTDDAVTVMKEIRALADKTTKMSGELKTIQSAIEDGGVK